MSRLAAIFAAAAALALPAAQAAEAPQPVLGIDGLERAGRLAWFDPATLAVLRGRKVSLGRHTGPWAFSADRSRLAIANWEVPSIRLVNARAMRRLGDVRLDWNGTAYIGGLAWARPDRLLVAMRQPEGGVVAVVDPRVRREVRRVEVPSIRSIVAVPGGMALLLSPKTGIGPAEVAVVDADGHVRTTALGRIRAGTVETRTTNDYRVDVEEPGFAVDPAARRAYVVAADFTVATVDLDTLALAYHPRSSRSLAKNVTGPSRVATWLGNGMLAVGGFDFKGTHEGEPVGLRLVDTRDWTTRVVDATVGWFGVGDGVLVAGDNVFGFDGALRYRVELGDDEWLSVRGPYGYVCGSSEGRLRRVLQLGTGTTLRRVAGTSAPGCPNLLYGPASG